MADGTDEASTSSRSPDRPSLRRVLGDHTGLIVTALGVALYGAVILRVAEGEPAIAFEILRSLGAVNATAGLTMIMLPGFAGVALILVLFWRHFIPRRNLLWPLLPIAVALVPVFYVGIAGVILLAEFFARRHTRKHPPADGEAEWKFPDAHDRAFIVIMVMSVITATITAPSLWLPTEVVRTADGESVLGYVLDPDADMVPILTQENRNVIYIPAIDVESRTLCTSNPRYWLRATVADIISWTLTDDNATVADCDDLIDDS